MRVVTPVFLSAFPAGVINIHPSLLPAFPGMDGPRKAFDYGVKVAGCTVHFVDEQVDHGPIIAQRAVSTEGCATPEELAARILCEEHVAIVDAVNAWAEGRLRVEGRRVVVAQR
jgi:phosphoribosylglycinamide formyltransferase-1